MKMLFISLLLLTLVGCAYSNSNSHWSTLYFNDSKTLADLNRQQYLADLNRQQSSVPLTNGGLNYITYPLLKW